MENKCNRTGNMSQDMNLTTMNDVITTNTTGMISTNSEADKAIYLKILSSPVFYIISISALAVVGIILACMRRLTYCDIHKEKREDVDDRFPADGFVTPLNNHRHSHRAGEDPTETFLPTSNCKSLVKEYEDEINGGKDEIQKLTEVRVVQEIRSIQPEESAKDMNRRHGD